MSGYSELASLGVTVRPLSNPKPPAGGRYSPFSATLTSTIEVLATELRALDAKNIVLELDLRDRDTVVCGLRVGARHAVEFTGNYYRGPAWQANLRAIALAMQALRAVDRYGVSKRGEQYAGWKQLEAGGRMNPAEARALIDGYGGETAALKATHPDTGGIAEDFQRVQEARRVLAGT